MSDAMIISGLISAFGNIIHAYEETKRINAQIEAIKADYRVKTRALKLKQESLELQHMENMEKIKNERENCLRYYEMVRLKVHASIEDQIILRQQTQDLLKYAMDPKLPQEDRESAKILYREAWGILMQRGDEAHNLLVQMNPNKSIAVSSNNLLDIEEK